MGFAVAAYLSFGVDDAAIVLSPHLFDGLAQGDAVALHCGEFRRCRFLRGIARDLRGNALTAKGQRNREQQQSRESSHDFASVVCHRADCNAACHKPAR